MTKIKENRIENLRKLVIQWDGPSKLSRKLGYKNPSFLVQMTGPNPTREITEKSARAIEAKLELPQGWLDDEHGAELQAGLDIKLVVEIIRRGMSFCEGQGIRIRPEKFADLIELVYLDATGNNGAISNDYMERLIKLVR